MQALAEDAAFRNALLALLESDLSPAEVARLESPGRPLYASVLHLLTHLDFSETQARRHWERVVVHRQKLAQALGREVGLQVALLDYFVNISKDLKNPKLIELAIYERTERSAVSDGLTGLYNHAYLMQASRRELQRSRRNGLKTSLLILDLDDFKRVNDERGHLQGDRVLRRTAQILKRNLREIDLAARYGGEEFAALLPDTPRMGAFVVAERIRRGLERAFRRRSGSLGVTLSGGVATYPDDARDVEQLVRRADAALYRSKAAGKNCITLAHGERRRYPRLVTRQDVDLSCEDGSHSQARARNVSAGGLMIKLPRPVPLGSRVTLAVHTPDGHSLDLRGEVVRVERRSKHSGPYEIGVRLVAGRRGTQLVRLLTSAA